MNNKKGGEDKNKNESSKFLMANIVSLVGNLGCGFLFLLIYEKELLLDHKFLSTMISFAISFPTTIFNTHILMRVGQYNSFTVEMFTRLFMAHLTSGAMLSSLVLCPAILIGYFFTVPTKAGVLIVCISQIILLLIFRWISPKT